MSHENNYALEAMAVHAEVREEFLNNLERVSTQEAQGVSLSRLLQKNLFKWRPWDTRWYLQYVTGDFNHEPSELSALLYRHLKLGLLGEEDRADGSTIEVGIYINANMEDFEKYNQMVEYSWDKDTFRYDPSTGKVTTYNGTKRGGVASCIPAPSPHILKVPHNPLTDDELSGIPRPDASWNLRAVWRIRIRVDHGVFKTSHEVVIPDGRTLLSGFDTDSNLSSSTLKMMDEVFGNKDKTLEDGDFSDGLRQLLAGEKSKRHSDLVGMISTNPSKSPGFWSALIKVLMSLSKLSTVVGIMYLFYMMYLHGWNVPIPNLAICALLLVGGTLVAALLVPVATAMKERSAVKSIG